MKSMKKLKYPKVSFGQYIDENNQWKIEAWINFYDIYDFDKKISKQMLQQEVFCIPNDDGSIKVSFDDFVNFIRKTNKIYDDRVCEYIRYIKDCHKDIKQKVDTNIIDVCKTIKERGNEIRKEINTMDELYEEYKDDIIVQVNNYIKYLADRCIIQDEPLINMYNMAYSYILQNNLNWLQITVDCSKYSY